MGLKIVLTGGGTGGHLYPGLAIIEAMKQQTDCIVRYIGTKRGVEKHVVPEAGYPFYSIWMSGIHRGRVVSNLLFPIKMMVSLIQSVCMMLVFCPDAVIGTGGYVSWPVMMAAWILRKSRYIQEQNQQPGLVTRILAPLMQGVFLSYPESREFFRRQNHLYICGNPTRQDLNKSESSKSYKKFRMNSNCTTLFIFGGSQGARGINRAMLSRIDRLMKIKRLQILWATGPRWLKNISEKTSEYSDRIRVFPFISDMGAAYSVADIIVCRSGATTIAEIACLGKPALFIPFPGAADNHQVANAQILAEAGAAVIVQESEICSGKLDETLDDLINNPQRCKRMAEKIRTFGHPDAARCIAERILSEIKK
ncbi:undecaprenyldiphospho-muramoylpentapeptide beta-N-acetylglucosaminyltransferase [bacterium]|nr:undecaprenyldiphospho-muramoylpentapeptide beta-N-acetylglucosaminyltransferase [bacterium]